MPTQVGVSRALGQTGPSSFFSVGDRPRRCLLKERGGGSLPHRRPAGYSPRPQYSKCQRSEGDGAQKAEVFGVATQPCAPSASASQIQGMPALVVRVPRTRGQRPPPTPIEIEQHGLLFVRGEAAADL